MSDVELPNAAPVLVETVLEESVGVPLEQADVVVSGGRGLGGPGNRSTIYASCAVFSAPALGGFTRRRAMPVGSIIRTKLD